jgi:hypothetical protein
MRTAPRKAYDVEVIDEYEKQLEQHFTSQGITTPEQFAQWAAEHPQDIEQMRQLRDYRDQAKREIDAEATRAHEQLVRTNPAAALQGVVSEIARDFPDVKTMADVANLKQADAGRFEKFSALMAQHQDAQQRLEVVAHREREAAQAAFDDYASKEDAAAQEAIPEYGDGEKYERLQDAAIDEVMELTGLSEDQIAQLYNFHPFFRGAKTQLVFAALGRNRIAREKAEAAKPKTPPKMMMPGVTRERASVSSLEAAARNHDMEAFVEMRRKGVSR